MVIKENEGSIDSDIELYKYGRENFYPSRKGERRKVTKLCVPATYMHLYTIRCIIKSEFGLVDVFIDINTIFFLVRALLE